MTPVKKLDGFEITCDNKECLNSEIYKTNAVKPPKWLKIIAHIKAYPKLSDTGELHFCSLDCLREFVKEEQ